VGIHQGASRHDTVRRAGPSLMRVAVPVRTV